MPSGSRRFRAAAWIFCGYLIAVILFGAWVRITHSGDGCGSNWPTCHGELVPTDASTSTLIEYVHRVTSGLCGLFAIVLLAWSWIRFGRGPTTVWTALALLLVIFEGAIGAGLVLGELVADDDSMARAIVVALHLTNTLALTASAALAAWHADGGRHRRSDPPRYGTAFKIGLGLVVAVAMSGAVTALGDTLFPRESVLETGILAEISDEMSAGNHFLVRLRVVHPALALVAALYLLWLLSGVVATNRWAVGAVYLTVAQVGIGFLDILLAAPGWLQILHLLVAQLLWIALVLAHVTNGTVPDRRPASPALKAA